MNTFNLSFENSSELDTHLVFHGYLCNFIIRIQYIQVKSIFLHLKQLNSTKLSFVGNFFFSSNRIPGVVNFHHTTANTVR